MRARSFAILLIYACILSSASLSASPVAVRYKEGSLHGFLVLSTLDGNPIAEGDATQVPQGNRITSHVIFRFKDGSRQEETAVFSQRGSFRLISYHLVQKGPAFPHATEITIASSTGQVTVNIGSQTNLIPAFAGAQGTFPALDQINILVPAILPATPNPVPLTVCIPGPDGQPVCSNAVNLYIR